MSERTFIPSGASFISNIQAGTQFNGNVISDGPATYFRIYNGGTFDSNAATNVWVAFQANTTAPAVLDAATASDPAWDGQYPGTLILQGEEMIVSITNGAGNKATNPVLFMANTEPSSVGTYAVVIVQPVKPL